VVRRPDFTDVQKLGEVVEGAPVKVEGARVKDDPTNASFVREGDYALRPLSSLAPSASQAVSASRSGRLPAICRSSAAPVAFCASVRPPHLACRRAAPDSAAVLSRSEPDPGRFRAM
jgi:hypothetical protein